MYAILPASTVQVTSAANNNKQTITGYDCLNMLKCECFDFHSAEATAKLMFTFIAIITGYNNPP